MRSLLLLLGLLGQLRSYSYGRYRTTWNESYPVAARVHRMDRCTTRHYVYPSDFVYPDGYHRYAAHGHYDPHYVYYP